jgi:hypothetical protein
MVAGEIIKITPRGIRNLRPLAGMRAERLPTVACLSSLTVRPTAMSGLSRSWCSSASISPFAFHAVPALMAATNKYLQQVPHAGGKYKGAETAARRNFVPVGLTTSRTETARHFVLTRLRQ